MSFLFFSRECSALSPHGFKDDECYTCSSLVSPHGFKNDDRYIRSGLNLPHGFKIDVYFMCSALVWPHGELNCKKILVTVTRLHRIRWSPFADI